MTSTSRTLIALAASVGLWCASNAARGGVAEWMAAVAAGTPAGYTNSNLAAPIVADIGTHSDATGGGISYEFIVNATNDGASSALIGTFENPPPVGDRAALKWEQWQDTGNYGATVFGVADFDSGVTNTPGVDTHLVFVNNGTDTALYVNGALAGTIAGASPTLSGTVGIGQAYNPAGAHLDPLTGTILGVAVYDSALGADEISAHNSAFLIPEPGSILLVGFALGVAVSMAPRRRT
ncbi:MAG TPA: LamG-like jellyroll fold domain-containing protein [Lacipirellulaceae bacterium]